MSDFSPIEGIQVPTVSPTGPAGIVLSDNFMILGLRSAAVLGPCRAVAVANVTSLSGTTTIDGVTLSVGDRVLLAGQTTMSQNGPWVIGSSWTRPVDFADEMVFTTGGLIVSVIAGTIYGGQQFEIGVYSDTGFPAGGSGNLTVDTSDLAVVPVPTILANVAIQQRTSDYTLTPADRGILQLWFSCSSGTFTLPVAANVTIGDIYYFANWNGSVLTVAVGGGSDAISVAGFGAVPSLYTSDWGILKLAAVQISSGIVRWFAIENIAFSY
jgi:hypothetical protein